MSLERIAARLADRPCRVGYQYGTVTQRDLALLDTDGTEADVVAVARDFATAVGSSDAYAFGAGRMALFAILQAAGIRPGDEVIVPAYTCVVVPNAIMFAGATPIYTDVLPGTFNMDPADASRRVTARTRVILAQHTFGIPADVEALGDVARRAGAVLVEDGCHAIGARHRGVPVGGAGAAAFWSTDATKMLCSEVGGFATTSDPAMSEKLRAIWNQTPSMPPVINRQLRHQFKAMFAATRPDVGRVRRKIGLSLNALVHGRFQMSDERDSARPRAYPYPVRFAPSMACLLGRQLARLDDQLRHRRRVASRLQEIFRDERHPSVPAHDEPSWVRYPLIVENPAAWRAAFTPAVQVGDWFNSPTYGRDAAFDVVGYVPGSCPAAERLHARTVNFPTHEMVDDDLLDEIARLYARSRPALGRAHAA